MFRRFDPTITTQTAHCRGQDKLKFPSCYDMSKWNMFVVNVDALAQASNIRIERRQAVFLCWMQDSNPGSQTPKFSSRYDMPKWNMYKVGVFLLVIIRSTNVMFTLFKKNLVTGLIENIHWGRVTHICVNKLSILGSDNGLSPGRRQAII